MYNFHSGSLSIVDTLLIHQLLHNGHLSNCGVQDINGKARRLMFELIDKKFIMPKSLFITDILFMSRLDPIVTIAPIGSVFEGDHKENHVVLKLVYKGHENVGFLLNLYHTTLICFGIDKDLFRKDLCRELLIWRSLSHPFVLPMSGIFEEKSQLLLVFPFMMNGTLAQWRNNRTPVVAEIQRLVRFRSFRIIKQIY